MCARSVLTAVLAASAALVVAGCASPPNADMADSTAALNRASLAKSRGWGSAGAYYSSGSADSREMAETASLNRASLGGSFVPTSGAATGYASYGYTDAYYGGASAPPPDRQNSPYPQLTSEDCDAIGRIAYAEAGNQGDEGRAAVIFTVLNRVASGRFQDSVQAVIDAPGEFEPINRVGTWRYLPPLSMDRGASIDAILNQIYSGALPDITNGGLFFQNARIVANRAGRGSVASYLVDFGGTPPVAEIGDHRFYDWRAAVNLAAARSRRAYDSGSYQQAAYDQSNASYDTVYQEGYGPAEQASSSSSAATTDEAEEAAPSMYSYGESP